jgi:hypothetical protein
MTKYVNNLDDYIPPMTEDKFQIDVAKRLDAIVPDYWTHVANEGERHVKVGAKNKRKGLKKGIPDVLIFKKPPCGGYVGAAIELKVGKNKCTPEQKTWLSNLEKVGWYCAVVYTMDQFDAAIKKLGW